MIAAISVGALLQDLGVHLVELVNYYRFWNKGLKAITGVTGKDLST
jgi:hypothetical protein